MGWCCTLCNRWWRRRLVISTATMTFTTLPLAGAQGGFRRTTRSRQTKRPLKEDRPASETSSKHPSPLIFRSPLFARAPARISQLKLSSPRHGHKRSGGGEANQDTARRSDVRRTLGGDASLHASSPSPCSSRIKLNGVICDNKARGSLARNTR